MGDPRWYRCKGGCGRTRNDETLSWTGLCSTCSDERQRENFDGLIQKTGPAWLRWRRSMAATVGGVLVDDVQAKP